MVIAKATGRRQRHSGGSAAARRNSADERCRRRRSRLLRVRAQRYRGELATLVASRSPSPSLGVSFVSTTASARESDDNRLAQPARRAASESLRIVRRDQHDVEVASQPAMLKAVVEQVQLRAESLLQPTGRRRSGLRRRSPGPPACAQSAEARRQIRRGGPCGSTSATPLVVRR